MAFMTFMAAILELAMAGHSGLRGTGAHLVTLGIYGCNTTWFQIGTRTWRDKMAFEQVGHKWLLSSMYATVAFGGGLAKMAFAAAAAH